MGHQCDLLNHHIPYTVCRERLKQKLSVFPWDLSAKRLYHELKSSSCWLQGLRHQQRMVPSSVHSCTNICSHWNGHLLLKAGEQSIMDTLQSSLSAAVCLKCQVQKMCCKREEGNGHIDYELVIAHSLFPQCSADWLFQQLFSSSLLLLMVCPILGTVSLFCSSNPLLKSWECNV